MPNWTQSDHIAQQLRQAPKHRASESVKSVELESDLHAKIIEELKRRRIYFVRSRTDKRTTTQLGVTDFICAMPNGKTLWMECKRKGGKLSQSQNITRHILLASGHWHAVIYNMDEFMTLIANQ